MASAAVRLTTLLAQAALQAKKLPLVLQVTRGDGNHDIGRLALGPRDIPRDFAQDRQHNLECQRTFEAFEELFPVIGHRRSLSSSMSRSSSSPRTSAVFTPTASSAVHAIAMCPIALSR